MNEKEKESKAKKQGRGQHDRGSSMPMCSLVINLIKTWSFLKINNCVQLIGFYKFSQNVH